MEKARARGVQFLLPTDDIIGTPVDTGKVNKKGKPVIELQNPRANSEPDIPAEAQGLDIGPETARRYGEVIAQAKTIVWNGPMGLFEDARFAAGTDAVARAVAEATAGAGPKASSAAGTA